MGGWQFSFRIDGVLLISSMAVYLCCRYVVMLAERVIRIWFALMNICMAYVVRRSMVAISENQVLRRYVRRHVIIVWRTHDTIPS